MTAPEPAALPVACTLGPDDGAQRMLRWQRLGASAQLGARLYRAAAGSRLEVRYRPAAGVPTELRSLAVAEGACCPFATWEVVEEPDQTVLRVTAGPEGEGGVAAIAALFGAG